MAHNVLHRGGIVDTDVVEIVAVRVVENDRRYTRILYAADYALLDIRVAYSVCHENSSVKCTEVDKIVNAVFAYIKALALYHTAESGEV